MATLPAQPTPLVGRDQLIEMACARLLGDCRLLTLTGPAGAGKTRLALAAAARLERAFPDGVFFVDLAPVTGPGAVLPAMARALGMREASRQPLAERLARSLAGRHVLLVLDNFEQVVEAAPSLSELLPACPRLAMLVTSREPLWLRWERQLPVPPLALPDPERLPGLEELARVPAVALFLERVRAVRPEFTLTASNAPAVARICVRLDGLPLAIELAASHIRVLAPEALLERLDHRLDLLAGGTRDAPRRHHSLRQALAWSYELLEPAEQVALQRLAVFAGGWALDAAEAILGSDAAPALKRLTALADKNLIQPVYTHGGEQRLRMLETIREYALERLEADGGARGARAAHAGFFLALAERADLELHGPRQAEWLERLEREHDNLQVALAWFGAERAAVELQRLAAALTWYWNFTGHWHEGRRWLEQACRLGSPSGCDRALAGALHGAGLLAWRQGDYPAARRWLQRGLELWHRLGDEVSCAQTLNILALVDWAQGDYDAAGVQLEQCLAVLRRAPDHYWLALVLHDLGCLALQRGGYGLARERLEESARLSRGVGNAWGLSLALNALGDVARCQGDPRRASALYQECLAVARRLNDTATMAMALHNLGYLAAGRGDLEAGLAHFASSLALYRELGNQKGIAECLAGCAGLAVARREPERAVRLLGAADAALEAIGAGLSPSNTTDHERNVAAVQAALPPDALAAAWAEGRAMGLQAAIEAALAEPQPPAAPARALPLSGRERQVVQLLASGLTNRQIAAELVVSTRTVDAHVEHVRNKLGVASRAQIATWAAQHGLLRDGN